MTAKTLERWNKEADYCDKLGSALAVAEKVNLAVEPIDTLKKICEKLDIAALAEVNGNYIDLLLYIDSAHQLAIQLHYPIDAIALEKLMYDMRLNMSHPEEFRAYRSYVAEQAISAEIQNTAAEDQLERLLYGY